MINYQITKSPSNLVIFMFLVYNMNSVIIYLVMIVIIFLFMVYRYQEKQEKLRVKDLKTEKLDIDRYFYNADYLRTSKRRKIWIHIPFEKNSRVWDNFGSRTSTKLNLSYMTLCIKSIIDWCSESYDIIVFDDNNIVNILPDTDIDLSKLSGPLLQKYREICLLKILHLYGGVMLPPSLYLIKPFSVVDLQDTWYVTEISYHEKNTHFRTVFSSVITGTDINNHKLLNYIHYLEKKVTKDFGEDSLHFGNDYLKDNRISALDGALFGIKDKKNNTVTIDNLMSNHRLSLTYNNIGLYIPAKDLLKRKKYQWFCKMSEEQVLETHCAISYYMLETV